MERHLRRVKSFDEREERELGGFWKSIVLVKDVAESKQRITLETILGIHKMIFQDSYPEIAGRFRKSGEDVKKLKCVEPPPGRLVGERIYVFWRELDLKISKISPKPSNIKSRGSRRRWTSEVIFMAAWAQHQIAAVHPFVDGNGRMARLMTNLILQRYGFKSSNVRYEGEKKEEYLKALCQADLGNYESLQEIIIRGVKEVYEKERVLRLRIQREKSNR